MYRFLMSIRYVNLLFMMGKDKNIHQLSRDPKINMTISHLSNVTDQWKKEGLITKAKKGRETDIRLTEIGKKLVEVVRAYDEIAITQINISKGKDNGKNKGNNQVVPSD